MLFVTGSRTSHGTSPRNIGRVSEELATPSISAEQAISFEAPEKMTGACAGQQSIVEFRTSEVAPRGDVCPARG
jgi:hypothetical protein